MSYDIFVLIMFLTAFTSFQLSMYIIYNHKKLKVSGFLGLIISIFIYSLFYSIELVSPNLRAMKVCAAIQYIGILSIPPFWVIMALSYTNHEKYLCRRLYIGLFILPVILVILNFTNDFHHLFYKDYTAKIIEYTHIAKITPGFGYILTSVYINLCYLIGNILYIRYFKKGSSVFRKRNLIILITSYIPWIGYCIYISGIIPEKVDIVPVFMEIICLIYTYALLKENVFETVAIARHIIFDNIEEAIIVLNMDNLLIDMNKKAGHLFGRDEKDITGKDFYDIFHCFHDIRDYIDGDSEADFNLEIELNGKNHSFKGKKTIISNNGNKGKIIVFNDNTQQVQMIKKLQYYGTMDILTGVYNRYHFYDTANELIQNQKDKQQPISLIMFDLDLFKGINDTYGHHAGDVVLQNVTAVCRSCLEDKYPIGRYGGEEFVIIINDLTKKQVYDIAENLRIKIRELNISYEDKVIRVTSSFGVYTSSDSNDLDSMIRNVDAALYKAKKAGRDQVYMESK